MALVKWRVFSCVPRLCAVLFWCWLCTRYGPLRARVSAHFLPTRERKREPRTSQHTAAVRCAINKPGGIMVWSPRDTAFNMDGNYSLISPIMGFYRKQVSQGLWVHKISSSPTHWIKSLNNQITQADTHATKTWNYKFLTSLSIWEVSCISPKIHSFPQQCICPTSSARVSPIPRFLMERWILLHSIPETVLISVLSLSFISCRFP